jgi:hypothetical protein
MCHTPALAAVAQVAVAVVVVVVAAGVCTAASHVAVLRTAARTRQAAARAVTIHTIGDSAPTRAHTHRQHEIRKHDWCVEQRRIGSSPISTSRLDTVHTGERCVIPLGCQHRHEIGQHERLLSKPAQHLPSVQDTPNTSHTHKPVRDETSLQLVNSPSVQQPTALHHLTQLHTHINTCGARSVRTARSMSAACCAPRPGTPDACAIAASSSATSGDGGGGDAAYTGCRSVSLSDE